MKTAFARRAAALFLALAGMSAAQAEQFVITNPGTTLSAAERTLLLEWLGRLADSR